jgi:hypothetical protein
MARTKVTSDQIIVELNAAFEKQQGYDANNRFRGHPTGASGRAITGYTTAGIWTHAHQNAFNEVFSSFELDIGNGA